MINAPTPQTFDADDDIEHFRCDACGDALLRHEMHLVSAYRGGVVPMCADDVACTARLDDEIASEEIAVAAVEHDRFLDVLEYARSGEHSL